MAGGIHWQGSGAGQLTAPVFNWFWQLPIDGKPGLCMVKDLHPGPDRPDVPFVPEALQDTIAHIEARIPKDLHLFQLQIYVQDILGIWRQVKVDHLTRVYKIKSPEFSQEDLSMLWDSRNTLAEPFGP